MNKTQGLQNWIESLDREKLEEIAVEIIERLIETEEVCYGRTNEENLPSAPYWDASGERLDGIED